MKRIVTLLVAAFATLSLGFSETIHIKHAYLMKKDAEGHVYIIRVKEDTGYHDWYVRDSDNPQVFYGYESDDKIIVDTVTDIAIKSNY